MSPPTLLAVPNVSEGRDARLIDDLGHRFAAGTRLLDVHSDKDHHRSVYTFAGEPGALADALLEGAALAVERVDVVGRRSAEELGQHPHVGAMDVAPIVYLDERDRGAACVEALVVGDRIGAELEVPVFLYGELTRAGESGEEVTRAQVRGGGVQGLAARMALQPGSPEALRPDFGPPRLHPTAGATLVAAREPLVAFNLVLDAPATVKDAREIAALIREGGAEGLAGVRAIGVELVGHPSWAQVSTNVERPLEVPLAKVAAAVAAHASIMAGELVGLAPAAALKNFPQQIPLPDYDPRHQLIENALGW